MACVDMDRFFDAGLDAVVVCSPPVAHAEHVLAALDHGSHVLTEKPMALSYADARAMVDAAETVGRVLTVSHNFLFSRSMMRAGRVLERSGPVSQAIGAQLSSPNRRLPTWYRSLPLGLFSDECPHLMYSIQHVLGPLRLANVRATWERDGHPATVEVQLDGAKGPGLITANFQAPVSEWHLLVTTRQSVIDIDFFRDIVLTIRSDGAHRAGDILRTSASSMLQHAAGFASSGAQLVARRLSFGHGALVAAFVEAARGGAPNPVDPSSAASIVGLVESVAAELTL